MAEEKNLPLPEKELPPPHDMLLSTPSGAATQPPTDTKQPNPPGGTSIWEKYGSKKWLLPLLIIIGILLVFVGITAFMGSSKDSDGRQSKKELRQNKKNNKNNNKKNKNKRQRNKNNTNAKTNAKMATFTYGTGANKITMRYAGDMKANITSGVSALDGTTTIPLITFTGGKNIIKMMLEPNTANLSAANWQTKLAAKNILYNAPSEAITVAGKPAIIQHTLSSTADWNAYIPMTSTMLWVDMNYSGGKNKAQTDFTEMLNTIQLGTQNTSVAPVVTGM